MKEDLSSKNVDYTYMDILSNLGTLKEYLHYRDNEKGFEKYKESGKLGIPLVIMETDSETKIIIEPYKVDFI